MAVEAIVSVVIDKFTVFVTDEAQVFAGVLKDKVDVLPKKLEELLPYLSHEEDKKLTSQVAHIRDLAYEAEDSLDTLISRTERRKKQIIIKRYTFIFNDLFARLKFLKEIKRIHTDIGQFFIDLERLNPELLLPLQNERIVRETTFPLHKGVDDIVGRERDKNELESRLIKGGSERRVISIVGMGGLGKTTLAHLAYNDQAIIRHFGHRAWIHVSSENTEKGLLKHTWDSIMYRTTAEVNNLTTEQKMTRMCEYLKDKRYLIVLDDVRDVKDWRFLQGALPETRNGSRVLLTTRQNSIASVVDPTSPPHEMKPLSADSSFSLLCYMLRELRPEPWLIGWQIAMKCGGLPIAIKVVAGLLRRGERTVEEWSRVLRDFSWDQLDKEDAFFQILDMGYTDLPFHLRPLFLYFLVFPKEHEIPVRRLFGLWHSEGIVVKREETVSWENFAHNCLVQLIDRSMVRVVKRKLDGKIKTCQIDGIVHDLFLKNASDIGTLHIHQYDNSTNSVDQPWSGVRRLVEYTDINDFSSLKPYICKSRSYISFNFRNGDVPAEVTGRFLGSVIKKGGFGLLSVLDLERVYKPELPESLGKLYRLKYLGLRGTFVDALPSSVQDLSFLETLDVKHTNVSHLPSSILKLKYLQHLYLNEIHLDMSSSTGHIASLGKNLQTLLGLSIIDTENPTKDILYKLIALKKLGLTYQGTTDEVFVKWISKLTALETLRLRSIDEYGRPSRLELGSFSRLPHLSNLYLLGLLVSVPLSALELPENLTVLTLSVSRLEQDPMPILEKLPYLKALRLLAHSYIGKKMVCSYGGFPSLRILKLWMLEELEEWSVENGAMPKLGEVEIRCCKRLKEVPQELLQLDSLKDLVLTSMPQAFIDEVNAFIDKAKAEQKKNNTTTRILKLVNEDWEFPTFADQATSLGGESSEIVPDISA